MYNKIINPLNNKEYLISSTKGKELLKEYVKIYLGGANNETIEDCRDRVSDILDERFGDERSILSRIQKNLFGRTILPITKKDRYENMLEKELYEACEDNGNLTNESINQTINEYDDL